MSEGQQDRAAGRADQPDDVTPSDFGGYLRSQRQLARLSLRQLAALARVSNPYLSQIERGLHKPSIAVVKSLASALDLSVDALLAQAAGIDSDDDHAPDPAGATEAAIREDPRLSASDKETMLAVYRSLVADDRPEPAPAAPAKRPPARKAAAKRPATRKPAKRKAAPPE